MNIVITGANGFIGGKLLAACQSAGHQCTGLDIVAGENTQACDITKDDIGLYIPDATDIVVHLAALSRDKDCRQNAVATNQVNVLGTQRLVEATKAKGVKQFVFASTEWVYDNFSADEEKTEDSVIDLLNLDSEYAASKLMAESNLKIFHQHSDLAITILRFGIIYGPRKANWSAVEALLNNVASKDEVQVGSLATGRCFIHVDDVIDGITASFGQSGFDIFNLQGNEFVSLEMVLNAAQEALDKQVKITESNPLVPSIRRVSNAKMTSELDWSPKYDIKSGINAIKNEVLGL